MVFLGLLPMKALSSAERQEGKKRPGTREPILKQYHNCLGVILQELIELQNQDVTTGKGCETFVVGKGRVYIHF